MYRCRNWDGNHTIKVFSNNDVRVEKLAQDTTLHFISSHPTLSPAFLVTTTNIPREQDIDDGDIKYDLILSSTSADPAYNNAIFENITAQNVDDDFANVVFAVHGSSAAVTHEDDKGVSTAAFDVRLSSEPTFPVTVTAVSDDPTEGIVSSKAMVFTKKSWTKYQKVELVGIDDVEVDGDIVYGVSVKMNSEDSSYSTKNLVPIPQHVVNKDDDFAGFTLRVCYETIPLILVTMSRT